MCQTLFKPEASGVQTHGLNFYLLSDSEYRVSQMRRLKPF
jgi:hypothetical protein